MTRPLTEAEPKWVAAGKTGLHIARIPGPERRRLCTWSDGKWSLWEGEADVVRDFAEPRTANAGKLAATAAARKRGWLVSAGHPGRGGKR